MVHAIVPLRNLMLDSNEPVVLIGDGKSDACIAGRADINAKMMGLNAMHGFQKECT